MSRAMLLRFDSAIADQWLPNKASFTRETVAARKGLGTRPAAASPEECAGGVRVAVEKILFFMYFTINEKKSRFKPLLLF